MNIIQELLQESLLLKRYDIMLMKKVTTNCIKIIHDERKIAYAPYTTNKTCHDNCF